MHLFRSPEETQGCFEKDLATGKVEHPAFRGECLVLDWPRYRIGDGKWQKADEILRVDNAVRDSLGVQKRGGRMTQPWAREKIEKPNVRPSRLNTPSRRPPCPLERCILAIEKPETFKAAINGQPVNMDAESGWWVDKSLRRIPLEPSQIKLGANTVTLICDYSELHPGLEMVYLLGQFGTKIAGTQVTMTKKPDSLKLGDWGRQGLAFYSGNLCTPRGKDEGPQRPKAHCTGPAI